MRIVLHVGLDPWAVERLRRVMAAKRQGLARRGILLPKSPGANNHTRLCMAVSDPDRVDMLRAQRGFGPAEAQAGLRDALAAGLAREVAAAQPEVLVLSAWQLGQRLVRRAELARLRALLAPLSERIEVVAHVEAPARMLARHYAMQVFDGRARPLSQELARPEGDWWEEARAAAPAPDPDLALFPEVQGPPHWLDLARFTAEWEAVFGPLRLRAVDAARLSGAEAMAEVAATLGLARLTGKAAPEARPAPPAAAWLARARAMNALFLRYIEVKDAVIPRQLWRRMLAEIAVGGPAIDPGSLAPVSRRLAAATAEVAAAHGLDPAALAPPPEAAPWAEADPGEGFRATQYLLAFRPRIDRATREARAAEAAPAEDATRLPPEARAKLAQLLGGPFAPHDRFGRVKEDEQAPPYPPAPPRRPPEGSTGRVIVACMKNEAPYVVEWVAYHRAIGVDDFLIYTNGCEDGTDALLARLQEMGVVRHRANDDWQGNSPQQHALDRALEEPVVQDAEWLLHIDVDEFVNVRCGDGTLDAFLARVPEATNVAMTWRLFGHSGVARLEDRFVIEQFTRCAPRFCPKPHTVWGFKTMFRNIGAYARMSCHRPNKLAPEFEGRVRWVNGSGADITAELARDGWRSSRRSVGYDLLQLNHYALRSAESFLVKRERGRALHVDRQIGLNYWIRMDWSDATDLTIQRNLPRLRAEVDRLMADPEVARLHARGLAWHRERAAALRATPEFRALYEEARATRLTGAERAAWSLALDMES
ncbi:glycosyltransferase family 2 protein [Rhodosalinus sp.]|uniref:glycosyltransferase family 2 protein n=1 Tax=Rhodosalinus sp. TaxID=2047741 RepID=UPI00356ADB79